MILNIDIDDCISEEEVKNEVKHQIKDCVQKICENDEEIKKMIIRAIANEIRNIQIDSALKTAVREKFNSVITEYYLNTSNHSLVYDSGITDKVRELLNESLSQFTPIIKEKLEKYIREYKIDPYLKDSIVYELVKEDEECRTSLRKALSENHEN